MTDLTLETVARLKAYKSNQRLVELLANESGREADRERAKAEVDAVNRALAALSVQEFEILWRSYIENDRHAAAKLSALMNYTDTHVRRLRREAVRRLELAMFGDHE